MTIENSKVIDLNIKKEDRVLDFSDFQKQEIKFDIEKLQEAYHQIVKIKKFEDAGVTHFGAISCLLYTSPSPRDATLSRMPSSA